MAGAAQPRLAEPPWFKKQGAVLLRAGLLLVPLLVLFADVFAKLLRDWLVDPNSSHGILIPPLAIYAIWLRRSALVSSVGKPRQVLGLILLLSSVAVYFVGRLGSEFFLTRISFLGILSGLTLFFLG